MTYVESITPIVKLNLKTTMLKSSLCDYSDVYILVKGTITVANTEKVAISNSKNINLIFKN